MDEPVLVVDDDRDVRDAVVTMFETEGYTAVGAADGRQALEMLKAGTVRPCAILLDLRMPRMDGWAFRAAQLCDPMLALIPVIVLSAEEREDVTAAAQSMRALAGMTKPVDWDELLRLVETQCRPTLH
jgi:two-component system, chemotaxis family, chemotaxis protein CheY